MGITVTARSFPDRVRLAGRMRSNSIVLAGGGTRTGRVWLHKRTTNVSLFGTILGLVLHALQQRNQIDIIVRRKKSAELFPDLRINFLAISTNFDWLSIVE